jgi:predicted nucleotidyltransferase
MRLQETERQAINQSNRSADPDAAIPHARAQEVLEMIIDTLRTNSDRLHGHKVVLFGSRARGSAKSRSDFDLGVVGEEPLPLEDFFALEDLLDELPTLYRIDWVDFARASDAFRARALQAVEVIHE